MLNQKSYRWKLRKKYLSLMFLGILKTHNVLDTICCFI